MNHRNTHRKNARGEPQITRPLTTTALFNPINFGMLGIEIFCGFVVPSVTAVVLALLLVIIGSEIFYLMKNAAE